MRAQALTYIENLIVLILVAVAGLTPLIFLDLTTDFFEMPKLIFLVFSTLLLYGLWIGSWVLKGMITFRKTPLNIPLLLLLVAILASTLFSSSKYISIYGVFPEVHGSAVSWTTYILLYFVTVSNLKSKAQVKVFIQVIMGSAFLISLVSLLSYFQVFLPMEMARGVNFTPTGSTFSTVALLLMLLPLSFISTVKPNKFLSRPFAMVLSTLFSLTIVLIGSTASYVLLLLVFIVSIYLAKEYLDGTTFPMLLTPFGLSALTLMLLLIPFSGNRLYESRVNFPKEIQLPLDVSWEISASSFGKSPIVGTGPSTFLYNFTRYKPLEFNNLEYWGFKFSSSYNEYLQALGVWGLFGLISLIALTVAVLVTVKTFFDLRKEKHLKRDPDVLLPALAIGSVVAVTLLVLHASSLVSLIMTLLFVASFVALLSFGKKAGSEFSVRFRINISKGKKIDPLPTLSFIGFLVLAFFVGSSAVRAVTADRYHRLALTQATRDGSKTYEYLQKAEKLNPYIDLYRVDMAQTNFALANSLVSQKGPTEENPEGNLTDEDKETIQTLISQAINEGRVSVELSPRSSRNWEVLGLIYRSITGVSENSLTLALDAYGRAIKNDPFNPSLRLGVGSIYYALENYDQAVRFYTDAVNLKPDYISGYYSLAVVLRDKGDLEDAKKAAEKVVELLRDELSDKQKEKVSELLKKAWVEDYSLATELLNEIKDKVDFNTIVTEENIQLQDFDLPEVDIDSLQ